MDVRTRVTPIVAILVLQSVKVVVVVIVLEVILLSDIF